MNRDRISNEELIKRLNSVIEKSETQRRIFKKVLTKLEKRSGVEKEKQRSSKGLN